MSSEKTIPWLTDENLKDYLTTCRAVVVDASPDSGFAVRDSLIQHGIKEDNITVIEHFSEAEKKLKVNATELLICDLEFNGHSSHDLIKLQESHFENRLKLATIVMCTDPSQIEVGMIIATGIDSALIKPFASQNLKDSLIQALLTKITPSQDLKLIEEGKALLKKTQYSEALNLFQQAAQQKGNHKGLAIFYFGHTQQIQGEFAKAIESFESGLKLNPQDYRCLHGIMECQTAGKNWKAAYDAASALYKLYPISNLQIPNLVRLSVLNQKFEDLNSYYEIFKNLKRPFPISGKSLVAGLLVCAKFFHQNNDVGRTHEQIEMAIEIARSMQIMEIEILQYCIDLNWIDRAESFFKALPKETRSLPELRKIALEISTVVGSP